MNEPSSSSGTAPKEALTTLPSPADLPRWVQTLSDGSQVFIRALMKQDAELERDFIRLLSPESRRLRFLGQIGEPSDALIRSLTDLDYRHEVAFIAVAYHGGKKREVGVSRYSLSPDGTSCECAVTVAEEWRHKGLGTALMRHLIDVARRRGIRTMISMDAAENLQMRELAAELGFVRKVDPQDPTQVIYRLTL